MRSRANWPPPSRQAQARFLGLCAFAGLHGTIRIPVRPPGTDGPLAVARLRLLGPTPVRRPQSTPPQPGLRAKGLQPLRKRGVRAHPGPSPLRKSGRSKSVAPTPVRCRGNPQKSLAAIGPKGHLEFKMPPSIRHPPSNLPSPPCGSEAEFFGACPPEPSPFLLQAVGGLQGGDNTLPRLDRNSATAILSIQLCSYHPPPLVPNSRSRP